MVVADPARPTISVHDLDVEERLASSRQPSHCDLVGGIHVDLEVAVVLKASAIDEAKLLNSQLQGLELSLSLIEVGSWSLTEGVHVVDVPPVGDQGRQCEVWPESDVVAAMRAVVLGISVDGDQVVDIVPVGKERPRIALPLRIEKNLIEHDISQEHNSPVLSSRPPWLEAIETIITFFVQDRVQWRAVC